MKHLLIFLAGALCWQMIRLAEAEIEYLIKTTREERILNRINDDYICAKNARKK